MKTSYNLLFMAASLLLAAGCHSDYSLSDKELMKEFADPGNEWRGKPFWAWNGKLSEEELLRQVEVMDSMGFGGYFMHSRVGLQTEYLGQEWFDLTNSVADYGEKRGMENYLYDEDRWPSGTAGGYVTQNPDFRMNFMTMKVADPKDFQWVDSLQAVFACKLDGTSFSDARRLSGPQALASVGSGESILAFYREKAVDNDFVNGFSYVDAMNQDATRKFIELTHDKYKDHAGKRIGTSIKGIFIDEPHRGPLFTTFSNDNAARPLMAPWTDSLPSRYKEMYGQDIMNDLPRLFLHENGATYDPVKWQYCNTTQQMFLDNFIKPLHDWCTDNNMELTGHVLHEDDFVSQVSMQGSLMRTYEFMQVPGIDILTQSNKNYWVAKQLQSVGRQTGKTKLLSELDGCTGWQMDFQDYKEIGDWQALFGINLRCPHLSWYTMEGEAKRDYPASINFQSGWWREYKYVEDYYARLGLMLAQGRPACGVLVVSPIESVMAQVAVDTFDGLASKSPVIAEQQKKYADLFHWLEGNHIDFDYGDEEMMGRLASVDKNADGQPVMRVGEAVYSTVFIGNMATVRSSTLKLLEDFVAAGGHVVCAGEIPSMVDVVPSEEPARVLGNVVTVPYAETEIVGAIEKFQAPMAYVTGPDGTNISDIYCQKRLDGDRTIYVFMNMNQNKVYDTVKLTVDGSGYLSEWNCRDGKVYDVNPADVVIDKESGSISISCGFEELQEYVYVVSEKKIGGIEPYTKDYQATGETIADQEYQYTLNEMNVLPLDFAYCSIDGKPLSSSPLEILKADRAIRHNFGLGYRGGAMLQPWYFNKFKAKEGKVYGNVELTFPFVIDELPESPLYLCMETPDRFSVSLNGQALKTADDGWWVDPCFRRIPVAPSMLKTGENTVALTVPFTEDLNLETLYLIGEFGVSVDVEQLEEVAGAIPGVRSNSEGILARNPRLTKLPSTLKIGDIVPQGLPFYSGTVSYNLGNVEAEALDLNGFVSACVVLRRGDAKELVAFSPYVGEAPQGMETPLYADLVLTRRNTFGPLHQLPARIWAYAPEMFVSEGDEFTNGYVLFRTGLLKVPAVMKVK